MADMQALIARLEAAEAGSAELDYLIDEALSEWRNIGGGFAVHKVTGERRRNSFDCSAPVTTSLDAALALAERVLPGWQITLSTKGGEMPPWVQIYPLPLEEDNYLDPEFAATPALALCIAILKAKAQGEGG